MNPLFQFDNTYAALPEQFYSRQAPVPVRAPHLIAYNDDLAALLGLSNADAAELAQVFSGNRLPEGATPIAQLYSGHQFGHYNPQLGDGRAVLLGEIVGSDGKRRDVQLKGSGPTPYSRRGDGRAWLGPVLREYVISEAMHALGIPTTRALAAVGTGEAVYREGAMPGAVLTRIASSHLRVGTFQVFAARGDTRSLLQLANYAIQRHYPDANGPMGLLAAVRDVQALLIAQWLSVGFIHGVMNTDNCTISGETIDYGPCAFLDTYHPDTVFSSIDHHGRYAYSSQADVIVWNIAQLATSLIPIMPERDAAVEHATEIVHAMPDLIRTHWLRLFGAKIGLKSAHDSDLDLITDLLGRMAAQKADFTNTFRNLNNTTARDQFADPACFDAWRQNWQARLISEPAAADTMQAANPCLIPRNHRIEQMIEAAVANDLAPFHRLLTALEKPYETDQNVTDLTRAPQPSEIVPATFCGT